MTRSLNRFKTEIAAALLAVTLTLAGCAQERNVPGLEDEVRATETAFARTMAERDFEGFKRFIAADAVFFSGPKPLRGEAAVAGYWKRFFDGPKAPFAWKPATVQVLESGQLALTSGPVTDAGGADVGTFTSIWRRESAGRWRIVFDKGNDACRCGTPP